MILRCREIPAMPTLYYRVEAPGVNILKSVGDDVRDGLLSELDLARYFKDAIYTMSSFMSSSRYSDEDNTPTLTKNRCDVDISYIMDKSQVPWPVDSPYTTSAYGMRASTRGNHTPILVDEKAGIFIEHQTVAAALEMNFTLSFLTFDDATRAFDSIKSRYHGSLIQAPFDLKFSYPVTTGMLEFLYSVYKSKKGYEQKTLFDYINDTKVSDISFDIRKSDLTNPNADRELMIRCHQLRCIAQVTMDQKEPEVARENDVPDYYTISFSAVFQFGRPNLIAAHTPVSVDNTSLPKELFKNVTREDHYDPTAEGIYQDLLCDGFMRDHQGDYNRASRVIRLPEYDNWWCVDQQYQLYKYRPFIIAHITLDGPVTTLNLRQLDDIKLHPIVQDIFAKTKNEIFRYGGLFNIGVYADRLRLGEELVSLDEDLNLTIRSDRPDKVYHIVLSETTELYYTDPKWDEILIKYRYFFPMTVARNLNTLIDKRYLVVAYDNLLLSLISRMIERGQLKSVLETMIELGEDGPLIYQYTQNPSQLADYLAYTMSKRKDYTLPATSDPHYAIVAEYYATKASTEGRSLLVAFLEQALILGYVSLQNVPDEYLDVNRSIYPYYTTSGKYYGFNTPFRVLSVDIIV